MLVHSIEPRGTSLVTSWVWWLLFSSHQEPPPVAKTFQRQESSLATTSATSFNTLECIPSGPAELCTLSGPRDPERCLPLLHIQLHSVRRLWHLGGLRTHLSSKIQGKKGIKYFSLFSTWAQWAMGPCSPCVPLCCLCTYRNLSSLPFTSLASLNSSWALGFLTVFLHVPYSSSIAHTLFHHLCPSFLCLSPVSIHATPSHRTPPPGLPTLPYHQSLKSLYPSTTSLQPRGLSRHLPLTPMRSQCCNCLRTPNSSRVAMLCAFGKMEQDPSFWEHPCGVLSPPLHTLHATPGKFWQRHSVSLLC